MSSVAFVLFFRISSALSVLFICQDRDAASISLETAEWEDSGLPQGADMNLLYKHHRASLSHFTVCPQTLSHSSLDGIQWPSSLIWLAGEEMAYGQSEVTSKGGGWVNKSMAD